jgi:hypothetical protein
VKFVQQHSTFTVQILYKLYSLQLNCTYSNHTQPAATRSATQHLSISPADAFCSPVQPAVSHYPISVRIHSVMSLDRTVQINTTVTQHSGSCSQHHKTHPNVSLFGTACIHKSSQTEIRSFNFAILAVNMV